MLKYNKSILVAIIAILAVTVIAGCKGPPRAGYRTPGYYGPGYRAPYNDAARAKANAAAAKAQAESDAAAAEVAADAKAAKEEF